MPLKLGDQFIHLGSNISSIEGSGRINTAFWMHYLDAKWLEKKLDGNYTRML